MRDWILFTEETPTVPVYAGFRAAETRAALRRKTEPSYMGTFTGARRYVPWLAGLAAPAMASD